MYSFLQAKGIPVKEAIKIWETKSGKKAAEATELKLIGQQPPIDKLDASLSALVNCEKLKNFIFGKKLDKITSRFAPEFHLPVVVVLQVRWNPYQEAIGDSLEELWISYNLIEKLKGVNALKKLQVLYMSNNLVKDWAEFQRLAELPVLEDLVFVGTFHMLLCLHVTCWVRYCSFP
ncbi:dynein light chain 1, axonemal-like [Limulus polyphemus]|uniref:Dynein axonemal light chain 1 n=1 Tax=Limulus polyphemus TaxID=6850 RepID=A0ABM1TI90_LIMPO|nr:dynein light chain 1, axonemal-like [Limulus polyphemus]